MFSAALLFIWQSVCVEQLTLDFEYLINEVIKNDAAWAPQFCSFSDYDVVILEVNSDPQTLCTIIKKYSVFQQVFKLS